MNSKDVFDIDPMSVVSLTAKFSTKCNDWEKMKELKTFLVNHWKDVKKNWDKPGMKEIKMRLCDDLCWLKSLTNKQALKSVC